MGFACPYNGGAFDEIVDTMNARGKAGCKDQCCILENVHRLMAHMTKQKMDDFTAAGFHTKIFEISSLRYHCSMRRVRLVIVGFRDPRHLKWFGLGPAPQTAAGLPLSSCIDPAWNVPRNTPQWLWLNKIKMHALWHGNQLVVGPRTTLVGSLHAASNYCEASSRNGGTWLCLLPEVADQPGRLTPEQLKKSFEEHDDSKTQTMRKLHPNEELKAMGWREDEMPPSSGRFGHGNAQYEAIGLTICPPVYEAFAERALWAMGKIKSCVAAAATSSQIETVVSANGVTYYKQR